MEDMKKSWLLHFAARHRYTQVLQEYVASCGWASALALLCKADAQVDLLGCTTWLIVSTEDTGNFNMAAVLVDEIYSRVDVITCRFYTQLATALKILTLFDMLRSEDLLVLPQLNKYFPKAGFKHPRASALLEKKLSSYHAEFRHSFLALIASQSQRAAYMRNGYETEYGRQFVDRTKQLLGKFLDKVTEFMPPTAIDKLLREGADSPLRKRLEEEDEDIRWLLNRPHLSQADVMKFMRELGGDRLNYSVFSPRHFYRQLSPSNTSRSPKGHQSPDGLVMSPHDAKRKRDRNNSNSEHPSKRTYSVRPSPPAHQTSPRSGRSPGSMHGNAELSQSPQDSQRNGRVYRMKRSITAATGGCSPGLVHDLVHSGGHVPGSSRGEDPGWKHDPEPETHGGQQAMPPGHRASTGSQQGRDLGEDRTPGFCESPQHVGTDAGSLLQTPPSHSGSSVASPEPSRSPSDESMSLLSSTGAPHHRSPGRPPGPAGDTGGSSDGAEVTKMEEMPHARPPVGNRAAEASPGEPVERHRSPDDTSASQRATQLRDSEGSVRPTPSGEPLDDLHQVSGLTSNQSSEQRGNKSSDDSAYDHLPSAAEDAVIVLSGSSASAVHASVSSSTVHSSHSLDAVESSGASSDSSILVSSQRPMTEIYLSAKRSSAVEKLKSTSVVEPQQRQTAERCVHIKPASASVHGLLDMPSDGTKMGTTGCRASLLPDAPVEDDLPRAFDYFLRSQGPSDDLVRDCVPPKGQITQESDGPEQVCTISSSGTDISHHQQEGVAEAGWNSPIDSPTASPQGEVATQSNSHRHCQDVTSSEASFQSCHSELSDGENSDSNGNYRLPDSPSKAAGTGSRKIGDPRSDLELSEVIPPSDTENSITPERPEMVPKKLDPVSHAFVPQIEKHLRSSLVKLCVVRLSRNKDLERGKNVMLFN